MPFANIMTFTDPEEEIRVKVENNHVYIYWQTATYLALNQAEAIQLRNELSRAITEAATAAAKAVEVVA
jgi:hypothetical protein